jgi:predicted ribosome quality control (RQC) complex YloA/Tae2 family protein
VVVPLGRGEEPSPELLVDAALLAAHFSDARGDTDVEVTWTRRRYVQKPRGAPPGSVRLLREKTILLEVDPDRLARLLDDRK